jgi:hypothetical protein
MKIKRVAHYQTTDGSTFDNKKDAQTHQRELDRFESLVDLISGAFFKTSPSSAFDLGTITVGDVAQLLIDKADELRSILPQRSAKTTDEPTQPVEVACEPTIENDMSWVGAGLQGMTTLTGVPSI